MDYREIIKSIAAITDVGEIDAISKAVKARRGEVAALQSYILRPGDEVRIVGNISPKYLLGERAIVDGSPVKSSKRINVKLVRPVKRFGNIVPISMPIECIEAV